MTDRPDTPGPTGLETSTGSPADRVRAAYRRIAESDRPDVWITLRPEPELLADADDIARRVEQGERLPLAGLLVAVKDNIDVEGLPTTAGCPSYAYKPRMNATAVARLVHAGALILGKTNLDQFATGLVGTRSPYGVVRHAHRAELISGGSSSGSAVAVALGIADVALGTDTAGSGRVPAALQGIIGIKPTRGLVPTTGVVPAARSYDCVSVFARTLSLAQEALGVITGPDPADPMSRSWPDSTRLSAGPQPMVAIPDDSALYPLSTNAVETFHGAVRSLRSAGALVDTIDVTPFLDAAKLLYQGALLAERYAAVGEFLQSHPPDADPTVESVVLSARDLRAHQLAADLERLDRHKLNARRLLDGFDALLLPTTTGHPRIADVQADPIGINTELGTYTSFVNLLDLSAVAVPAGTADGSPFGVSVIARAFDDQAAIDIAAMLTGEQSESPYPATGIALVVFGAHLTGQPLNRQLTDQGARLLGQARTAAEYRMFALRTDPPKPGVVRVARGGASLLGEVWSISPAGIGRLLAQLPAPMSLGPIVLDNGTEVIGFLCDSDVARAGDDITDHGGWRSYLAATEQ